MKVSIKSDLQAKRLTLTLSEVDFEKLALENFYQAEKRVQQIVNQVGQELTREILQSHDVDDQTIERDDQTWYRKEASLGHYQTLYGEVSVARHLYQTSAGGATRCPLEEACGLSFLAATPLLAETLGFKVSALPPGEVAQDLTKHGLQRSPSFIRAVAQQVGQIAVEKATAWKLEAPAPQAPVAVVATGLDGTTLPIRGEDYKEAMCGTIALYDKDGERLSTEYLGAMPEAGKAAFTKRLTARVAQVLGRYPQALHVVLSDGALWNWQIIKEHYPEAIWILDFWHEAQRLAQAADAIFGSAPGEEKSAWFERWKTALRDEPDGVAGVIRTLMSYRNRKQLRGKAQQELDTQLNYFRAHADKMQYADYVAAGLPIGSGVTEAGCKELIKARFCRSGMRWNRASGAKVLQLRAIRLSDQWDSFWSKVMRYAA
jgi:phenylpyruvate tautomerase PptA (4-oxalocrotonate tautomerase family)